MPITKPDPVSASTSSGIAVLVIASPKLEYALADQDHEEVAVLAQRLSRLRGIIDRSRAGTTRRARRDRRTGSSWVITGPRVRGSPASPPFARPDTPRGYAPTVLRLAQDNGTDRDDNRTMTDEQNGNAVGRQEPLRRHADRLGGRLDARAERATARPEPVRGRHLDHLRRPRCAGRRPARPGPVGDTGGDGPHRDPRS